MKTFITIMMIFAITSITLSQTMNVHTSSGTTTFNLSQIDSITFSVINPIAWWPLDEDSGTVVYDHTSNGYNGTVYGNITWVTGGINLNGGNNSVDFQDSVFRMSEGSWQVVINADSGQSGWIMAKDGFGFNDDGIIRLNPDGTATFEIQSHTGSITYDAQSSTRIPFGVDVTITAEWGSQGMKVFINNASAGNNSYSGPILSIGRPLSLGLHIGNPVSFNGIIKEAKVFSKNIW